MSVSPSKTLPEPSREAVIYKALSDAYPVAVSAKSLMEISGLAWRSEPVLSFHMLCISLAKIRVGLSRQRFRLDRTGSTPEDSYWLHKCVGGV
ncbi:hypothetical protein EV286_107496 [Rhizobium sp. BK251]|nr:hypothetical protein EV286_107496 [Rhizobium sp. BK251]